MPDPASSGFTTMWLNEREPVQRPREGDETRNVILVGSGVTFCEAAGRIPSRSAVASLQPLFASATDSPLFAPAAPARPRKARAG